MERNLDEAKFVLMVCTETYRRRVMGREEPGKGLGGDWEGNLIYNQIYHDRAQPARGSSRSCSPARSRRTSQPRSGAFPLRLATFDLTDPGFEALYRHLTGQPATPRPDLGPIQILPPKPRPQPSPSPLPSRQKAMQNAPEVLNKLKKKLKSLSSEKISDEEDDEPKGLLVYLHKTSRSTSISSRVDSKSDWWHS